MKQTDRDGLVRCRVCRCTEIAACQPPGGWEPGEGDLCTSCADTVRSVLQWMVNAHHPSRASLLRELDRAVEAAIDYARKQYRADRRKGRA